MAVTRRYAQINACTNEVILIGDASMGMPVADTNLVYTINIFEHSQRDTIDVYWKYNKETGLFEEPSLIPLPLPSVQETIAVNAEKDGTDTDTIVLTIAEAVATGTVVKFTAPCSCIGIAKVKIFDTVYDLVDAVGNSISEISEESGGVFAEGAVVVIALNVETKKAYIQNAAKTINETTDNLKQTLKAIDILNLLGITATATELNVLDGILASVTELNYLDDAKSNIQKQIDGKAASSHGNHVPATETASNKRFLRNDNTWQAVTPANIGAATSDHNHDSSYLKQYGLNAINIDSTGGNWTVDISDGDHGTVPMTWVNVTQTTGAHFLVQVAKKCDTSQSTSGRNQRLWIRDKYSQSGVWSEWKEILTSDTGIQKKLLWTNASPTSNFAAQNITLDLSEYDEVEIIYQSATRRMKETILIGSSSCLMFYGNVSNDDAYIRMYSRIVSANNAGVEVEACYGKQTNKAESLGVQNNHCVPYKIYGIRGVQ